MQCRFGFSNGAWARAVDRGDIVPRPKTGGLRASEKRAQVARLRADGKTYVQIAKELGLTKSTVAYHARRLGVPADERFSRRYDWNLVQAAIDAGASMRQCMKRFGFSRDAWGKGVKRGDIVPDDWVVPLEALLAPVDCVREGTSRAGSCEQASKGTAASGAGSASGRASR